MKIIAPNFEFTSDSYGVLSFLKAFVFYHHGETVLDEGRNLRDYIDDLPTHVAIDELLSANCAVDLCIPSLDFTTWMGEVLAYEAFVKNYNEQNDDETSPSIEDFLAVADPTSFIASAFVWAETKEGTQYWEYISDAWEAECGGS